MEGTGWKINRVNYQGDIGLHVAKCLWALKRGDFETPESLEEKVGLYDLEINRITFI